MNLIIIIIVIDVVFLVIWGITLLRLRLIMNRAKEVLNETKDLYNQIEGYLLLDECPICNKGQIINGVCNYCSKEK